MTAQTDTFIPSLGHEAIAPPLSSSQLLWRRFRKHKMAIIGGVGFILLLLFIIVGSILIPEKKANEVDLAARLSPPTSTHLMGTDSTGRDVFARIIYGGQISLLVGVLAVIISVSLGTLVGGVAGYFGGWVDST